MRARTPPFTKPEAAYDARRLYDETSAIAAAEDAKLDPVDAALSSILADFRAVVGRLVAYAERLRAKHNLAELAVESQKLGLYGDGAAAESAYLASFGPNADIPPKSPKADRRVLTDAERKAWGIGDIEPATLRGIPDSFTDSHGNRITRRDATRHPMHAEALRDHDERLFGGEDRL